MKKTLRIFGIVFFAVGLMITIFGIKVVISTNQFMESAVKTQATITRIDTSYDSDGDVNHTASVEFTVDGSLYKGTLNYYTSAMYVGGKETIYYDPSNPNHFQGSGSKFATYIAVIVGGIFMLVGGGILIVQIILSKKKKKVLSYNYVIQANIIGFNIDTTMSVNGRNPYKLEASYINPNDGKMYTYRSESIWANLTPILQQRNITTIPVYVNPNNYAEYVVDISNLKQFIGN